MLQMKICSGQEFSFASTGTVRVQRDGYGLIRKVLFKRGEARRFSENFACPPSSESPVKF
jgi:hypothetical protein